MVFISPLKKWSRPPDHLLWPWLVVVMLAMIRPVPAETSLLVTTSAVGMGPFKEAPVLSKLVAEGKLPAVEQRLPDHPALVEPVDSIGKFGGTWRRLSGAIVDTGLNSRLGYEPLLRWDRTGRNVVPGVAESWEVKDDAKTYIFHLRKGMRWSDGHPFTSEDFLFSYENFWLDDFLTPVKPQWLVAGGEMVRIEAPDPYTVVMRFAASYGSFPYSLAFYSQQSSGLFEPKHYLKQYHAKFVPEEELLKMARVEGGVTWQEFYGQKANLEKNPDLPTINAFKVVTPFPANRTLVERNPYYWKVDPAGNQLPYIDEISYATIFDNKVLNLKAMAGDVDFQIRRIDPANFTLFMEAAPRNGYHVLRSLSTNGTCIYLNQWSLDEDLRPILQDRRFRLALSCAINRQELIDLVFTGLADPSSGFIVPLDPYYLPGMDKAHTEYNPDRANQLLDEIGMRRDGDGMRQLPNGKPFHQILHVYPSEEGSSPDVWQLVGDYWREVGLQFTVKHEEQNLSVIQVTAGRSDFWAYTNAGLHWAIEGIWKVPLQYNSYVAPLFGRYTASDGRSGVKPTPEFQQLIDWYWELRSTPDAQRRLELGRSILKQWEEQCYVIGICRTSTLAIVSNRFRNVPDEVLYDYRLKGPGYIGIEQFYLDEGGTRP